MSNVQDYRHSKNKGNQIIEIQKFFRNYEYLIRATSPNDNYLMT